MQKKLIFFLFSAFLHSLLSKSNLIFHAQSRAEKKVLHFSSKKWRAGWRAGGKKFECEKLITYSNYLPLACFTTFVVKQKKCNTKDPLKSICAHANHVQTGRNVELSDIPDK